VIRFPSFPPIRAALKRAAAQLKAELVKARECSRAFGQVEPARAQVSDFCDAVLIPYIRDKLAVRFRQIRSMHALGLTESSV